MTDARTLTQDLGGKWYRNFGAAPCPICQPGKHKGQNALTLADGRDGRLLANCKKLGCSFTDILAAAGLCPGDYRPPNPAELAKREAEARAIAQRKAMLARTVWDEARPIPGTLAETYLRNRGITCDLPDNLRFHGSCWHGPTAARHPALVALVQGGETLAVHRTYLAADGMGKAPFDPAKMMLGGAGGGAVHLTQGAGPLVVAEGIETALSLASGLLSGPATIWAALSTSGLRGLVLPKTPHRLTIATDGDDAGRTAGHALAERAHALGWQVSLLSAPEGRDWNDILRKKGLDT